MIVHILNGAQRNVLKVYWQSTCSVIPFNQSKSNCESLFFFGINAAIPPPCYLTPPPPPSGGGGGHGDDGGGPRESVDHTDG